MNGNPKSNNSMYGLFLEAAQKYPQNVALACLGRHTTYAQLSQRIDEIRSYLVEIGATKIDVITIALPNIPSAVAAFYAANSLGCNINMVHPLLPSKEIIRQMKKTNSRILFLMDTMLKNHSEILDCNDFLVVVASPADFLCKLKGVLYRMKSRKDLKLISKGQPSLTAAFKTESKCNTKSGAECGSFKVFLHSGGTSGEPKTIVLSNKSINALALRTSHMLSAPADVSDRRMLMVLPMFHGFGLCMCMHSMLIHGGRTIMIPRFNAKNTLKTIVKERADIMIGIPALYKKLFDEVKKTSCDLSFLKNLFVGGDTLTEAQGAEFEEILRSHGCNAGIMEGYGLTESVTVCAVNTLKIHKKKTVGLPLPDMDIRILDEGLAVAARNTEGEIAVCSDTLMNGYLGDDELNKQIFVEIDGKTFLRTGDFGHMDEDGFLYFKQRMSRIFKYNGLKIFPSEVENALMDTGLVSAVGVVMTDGLLTAHIVLSDSAKADGDGIESKIKSILGATLPYWCVPKIFVIRDSLPTTAMNKIDHKKL